MGRPPWTEEQREAARQRSEAKREVMAPHMPEGGELITYRPAEGGPAATTWRGIRFPANVPIPVTDKSMIDAARNNRYFQVGDAPPFRGPDLVFDNPAAYRTHVHNWLKDLRSCEDFVKHWADDGKLRGVCGVGEEDYRIMAPYLDAKLEYLAKYDGLDASGVSDLCMRYGVTELAWR